MSAIVIVEQYATAWTKDPDDTSHVGWLAHLKCGHLAKHDPTKYSNDGSLPQLVRCPECYFIARKALEAHGAY